MIKRILSWFSVVILSYGLVACNDSIDSVQAFNNDSKPPIPNVEKIAEVATPSLIEQLNQNFVYTQPQVKIISPSNGEVFNSKNISVSLEVKGLDIFKDEELQMGPHLHFFVDNQPYQAIYSTEKPIILSDLTPGTHTIRVFASRPWHESFKNEGAYAQTTFHVFTATDDNNPSDTQPLLTYSRPQGIYGAEPIMLDFYLTNTPLHAVAKENPDDDISDWRIRVTVNGESFLLDTWQPIYLKGFNKGENWVKLEFIDENGNMIKNAFNSTVRAFNYDPKTKDTLSKLVTDKISFNKAQAITIRDYPTIEEVVIPEEEIITNLEESLPTINPEENKEISPIIEEEKSENIIKEEIPIIEEKQEIISPELTKNLEEKTLIIENPQETTPIIDNSETDTSVIKSLEDIS